MGSSTAPLDRLRAPTATNSLTLLLGSPRSHSRTRPRTPHQPGHSENSRDRSQLIRIHHLGPTRRDDHVTKLVTDGGQGRQAAHLCPWRDAGCRCLGGDAPSRVRESLDVGVKDFGKASDDTQREEPYWNRRVWGDLNWL